MAADPKQHLAELYSRVAVSFAGGAPRFACAGRRLVEVGRVGRGDVVLDVATGRGAVLLPAAECVGPSGRVVGIDIAPGMIEQTRLAIASQHVDWAEVHLMDADHLEFADASFTHVLCSFAVFFFPDVPRVLAEMRRVLRHDGVVGFAFERGVDPRWAWYEELLRTHGALEDPPSMPGSGAIRGQGALVAELAAAGFGQPRELVEDVDLGYPDPETWWASLWTHGSRRPLERLSAERLDQLQSACLRRAREMTTPEGLPERHRLVYVTASA